MGWYDFTVEFIESGEATFFVGSKQIIVYIDKDSNSKEWVVNSNGFCEEGKLYNYLEKCLTVSVVADKWKSDLGS